MTQVQQPEALRLAHALSGGKLIDDSTEWADTLHDAAAELRHQHARITELEEQLSAIGAGGVGPVRKRAAPAHPAEGVPAQIETLRAELAEETEAAENWRRLALQFDNHRMQAIGHLKAVTNPAACFDKYKAAKAFLSAPPLGGEEVLAQRIATLAAQAKQGEQQ